MNLEETAAQIQQIRAAKNIWTVLGMLWIKTIRLKTWYCFIIAV
jgi:hypothetical protein